MPEPVVFIVSEDLQFRQTIKALVESAGLRAATYPALQALLDVNEGESRGCLVFCPENHTLDDPVQRARLRAACAVWPGILISERGNIPLAVLALKAGIGDIVQKPYRDKELLELIEKVLEGSSTV